MPTASIKLSNFKGERLSLKMFGARGNGVTSDTSALQAAFDSGQHIFVPAGDYLIDAPVIKDLTSEAGFFMDGRGNASKFTLSNKATRIEMYGAPMATTHDSHCYLRNFTIDCKAADGQADEALFLNKLAIWGIENVRVRASQGYRNFTINGATLVSITIASSVATVQTATPHLAIAGDALQVAGDANTNLNDAYFVLAVTDATHFTFPVYGAFPVADGAHSSAGLSVSFARMNTAIKLSGSQKGHIYGGSIESAAYGVKLLRLDGIGCNQVNISKGANFSDNYLTAVWYNGVDDGILQGCHITQGRFSIRVTETGSGGVEVIGNHFEFMQRYGYYQEGGRATVLSNKFYNEVGTVSAYIPTASDIRFCFNQCNKDVHFGPDGSGPSGVFSGVCAHNAIGGSETYEGTDHPLHYDNSHLLGGAGPSSNAVMRLREPSYEWEYTPVSFVSPTGPCWKYLPPPTLAGKYLADIKGGGAGAEQDFTADAALNTLNKTAHTLVNGDEITLRTTTTLPAGLLATLVYRVISSTANAFQVAVSLGGAAVDITDTGTGTHYFRIDQGAGNSYNSGASEIFVPTSNNRFRLSLPVVIGGEVGKVIAAVIDSNGMQIPYGGTGVTSTAKGSLLVGTSSSARANLAPGSDGKILATLAAAADGTGLQWQSIASTLGSLTNNVIPKYNGTALADSSLSDDGTTITSSEVIQTTGKFRAKSGSNTFEMLATGSVLSLLSTGAQCKIGTTDVSYFKLEANAVDLLILDPINNMVLFSGTTSSFPGLLRSSDSLHVKLADNSGFTYLHALGFVSRISGIGYYVGGTTASFPALKNSGTTLQVRLADDSAFAPISAASLTLTTALAIAQGGTGSTTAAGARTNLLLTYQPTNGSLTGQTGTQTINLLVAGAMAPAGVYTVCWYFVVTTIGTGTAIGVTAAWNDGVQAQSASTTGTPLLGVMQNSSVTVRSSGSAHITLSVTQTAITVNPVYSLYYAMEQLI